MVYRMYIATEKQGENVGWSFMIFNHQDFNIYKRCGKAAGKSEKDVILETSAAALDYFSNFIRRRYYDEHFATILDEDYISVHTALPEMEDCWKEKRYTAPFSGDDAELWKALIPYFSRPTMSFETAAEDEFFAAAEALAKAGLEK